MITLQIKYLGAPQRWKVIDGVHPNLMVSDVEYAGAAERFIQKYWPDCTIRAFGQLPTGDRDNVALASYDEEDEE